MAPQILLFTRYPVAGQVKTRLIPALGPEGAALLHRRMTERVLKTLTQSVSDQRRRVTICHTGASREAVETWLGRGYQYHEQAAGHLGLRLKDAFNTAFRQGTDPVLAVGSDCPFITVALIRRAIVSLRKHSVVLGPALDGGYYLIGLRSIPRGIFGRLDWGGPSVLKHTLALLSRQKIPHALLPPLPDIDVPADLAHIPANSRLRR